MNEEFLTNSQSCLPASGIRHRHQMDLFLINKKS